MTSRWRQRESGRPSSWRQSLLFNSLLLLLPIMAARIVASAYTSDIATDPMGLEARTETRAQIEQSFKKVSGPEGKKKEHWAMRVEQTLRERDFSAARGYLLAAPLMLNRDESLAVLAAAEAEDSGTRDQRLARASLLFLPDPVRASYERAIAPPQITSMTDPVADAPVAEPDATDAAVEETAPDLELSGPPQNAAPFTGQKAFFLLGDPADLARQSQRWLRDEQVDSVQLRLRALGLMKQRETSDTSEAFVNAASVLRAAQRSGRLNQRFDRYISTRIENALPEGALRTNLADAFGPVMTTSQRGEMVMTAYAEAIDPDALARLTKDMVIIARLAEITSSSGALTLVELASTPDDMRRALLLTESGGERSVALARELGPDVLNLAQIGVKWTRTLVLQVMALMALGMALLWTALSAFTQAETIRPAKR